MRPPGVAEPGPVIDDLFALKPLVISCRYTASCFRDRQSRSMKILSRYLPRPSIEILISALVRVVIQSAPVYWLPWPVFTISGFPYLAMAAFSASTQKLASRVFESRQYTTLRIAQSRIATSYRKPFLTGM